MVYSPGSETSSLVLLSDLGLLFSSFPVYYRSVHYAPSDVFKTHKNKVKCIRLISEKREVLTA